MAELEVDNLSLRFGGLTVLDGISFAVEPAELFALIGPNGAGKTSALQLHQPHLSGRGPHPLSRQRHLRPVAARGRQARHRPHLPARRAVPAHERARQHHDRPPRASRHQPAAADAVPRPRCGARRCAIARRSSASSSSWSWRACATRMRARCPSASRRSSGWPARWRWSRRLLLLDEPSAGLTRDERDDLARFILRIKHELKLPMVWIEHDMQMVADLADRIHVLELRPHAGIRHAGPGAERPRCGRRLPGRPISHLSASVIPGFMPGSIDQLAPAS